MLHLVIMAGGSGTRFWPESRRARPKQFLTLAGDRSLLQQAADRCRGWVPPGRMWVVTNALHADETRAQLPDLDARRLLLEPCGRNTAPCLGLAAVNVLRDDPDAVLLVTPADHLIRPESEFRATVDAALKLLEREPEASILFGIPPTYPATGYGYIERREQVSGTQAFRVASFREKPTAAVAQTFLDAGRYDWNAGIFVWRAAHLLRLLERYQPAMYERLMRLATTLGSARAAQALESEFPGMPAISIDHGVLEPAAAQPTESGGVFVVPAAFKWDDVGGWRALADVLGHDADRNAVSGPACSLDTTGCLIRTTKDHLVATIGVNDLVVVHTPDATLVAPKDDEAALRKLVALLDERGYGRFL
ncbi:MAG: mannose-1-phosphate guanylyltransferase [Planctomycetaceae bacterium]